MQNSRPESRCWHNNSTSILNCTSDSTPISCHCVDNCFKGLKYDKILLSYPKRLQLENRLNCDSYGKKFTTKITTLSERFLPRAVKISIRFTVCEIEAPKALKATSSSLNFDYPSLQKLTYTESIVLSFKLKLQNCCIIWPWKFQCASSNAGAK